jgi:DNA-binding MurR/RpiR family transcriptional regulator
VSPVLKPTTDLANRIASLYPSLSDGASQGGRFRPADPLDTATMTIEGLAEKSGTSTATVTRFVRALGLTRLWRFPRGALGRRSRSPWRRSTASPMPAPAARSPYATLTTRSRTRPPISTRRSRRLDEAPSRAPSLLLKARRIFIVGSGASHHVASFLEDGLALYLEADVIFASSRGGPERAIRHMLSAGPRRLVIAISMPRYSRTTLELAASPKARRRR